jgi:YidC/Oxa1 family membrane protein insertase
MADESNRLSWGLIAATIIIVSAYFALRTFAPSYFDAPPAEAQREAPAPRQGAAEAPSAAVDEAARAAAEVRATLETDDYVAEVSSLNTGFVSFRLKGERYHDDDGAPIDLVTVDREGFYPFRFELTGVRIPADAVFEVDQVSKTEVHFRYEGKGFVVTRKLEVGKSPFQLWSTVTVHNRDDAPRTVSLREEVYHYVAREDEEQGFSFLGSRAPALSHGMCFAEEDDVREPHDELATPIRQREGVRFAGVENTYFTLAMSSPGGAISECALQATDRGRPEVVGSLFEASLTLGDQTIAPGESGTFRTMAYVGPKDLDALQAAGSGLDKIVDLGWFGFLARGLIRLLRFIYDFIGNWGLAIILLTLMVKLVLYPLTAKSFQSMAKMRLLKPEMDRINELYGEDREKKGAAIMELYKKHQINPLAGCLPSLLQMPVWVALYQSLSTNIELYHAPFVGYWTDLSSPDQYLVLPLIVGLLMFVQQRMTPSTMDPMQAKIMMYMMPIMITAFMLFLPAGLCLYMVTNSTLGIAQQRWIHYRLDRQTPTGPAPTDGPGGESDLSEPEDNGSTSVVSTRRTPGSKKRSQRGRA